LQLEINSEGAIVHPSFGKVEVAGEVVTLAALRSKLLNHLKTFFKMHEIDVSVSRPLETTVEVIGEVKFPRSYRLSNALTLSDLIDSAGGILPGGSQRAISVIGFDTQSCDLLRAKFLHDRSENPYLYGIRRVIVPPSGSRVRIDGDVIRPGSVEFTVNESLESLFPLVGGLLGSSIASITQAEQIIKLPHTLISSSDGQQFEVRTEEGRAVSMSGAFRNSQKGAFAEQSLQQVLATVGGFSSSADSNRVVIWRRMTSASHQEPLRYPLVLAREFFPTTSLIAGDSVVAPVRRQFVEVVEGERAQAIPYQKVMTVRELLSLAGKKSIGETTHDLIIRDGVTGLEIPATVSSRIFDGDRLIALPKVKTI
jgi:protein involved in polysaccharide export with SLBB domain